jgi:hypothetical protein
MARTLSLLLGQWWARFGAKRLKPSIFCGVNACFFSLPVKWLPYKQQNATIGNDDLVTNVPRMQSINDRFHQASKL